MNRHAHRLLAGVSPSVAALSVFVACSGSGPSDGDSDTYPPLPAHCTVDADDADPGNNQPDWTRCQPEQVCVLASLDGVDHDGAPLFTCVTPTPAPAIDPGLHVKQGWAAYEVATARCNNGDRARFWFRPARDAEGQPIESDDWVVFLKGGGGCASAPSCALRWTLDAYYVAPPRPPQWTPSDEGIFRTADNAFTRTHQVYVHYCTSDAFRGTGPRSPHTGLHHDGHLVVEQVVDALTTGIPFRLTEDGPSQTFTLVPDARLLLSGGSAGSMGAAQNLDYVADRLDGPVAGLLDSLWVPSVLPMHHRASQPDFDTFHDASCVAANPSDPQGCAPLFAVEPYLQTPFFAYMAARDGLMHPYGGLCVDEVQASECVAPDVLVNGLCFRPTDDEPAVEPCDHGEELNAVDPHGLACWDDAGAGQAGYVASERARHVNQCASTLTADGIVDTHGDCGDGYTCWAGHCVREDFDYVCQTRADCPIADDVCAGGLCVHSAVRSGPDPSCLDDAYTFDEDTGKCRLSLGCASAADCGSGEVCLDAWHTPAAPSLRMGVRQGLRASSVTGWFVTDGRRKHTIINTEDNAFHNRFPAMRPDGADRTVAVSLHDTLVRWMAEGPGPQTRLMQDPQ